ncbi:YtxH domain-containing protein [Clostridium sp. DL1XJH146]
MSGRYIKGITAGAMLGAAAGMMMIPRMKRSTRRRIMHGGKRVINTAEDVYDAMMHMVK